MPASRSFSVPAEALQGGGVLSTGELDTKTEKDDANHCFECATQSQGVSTRGLWLDRRGEEEEVEQGKRGVAEPKRDECEE